VFSDDYSIHPDVTNTPRCFVTSGCIEKASHVDDCVAVCCSVLQCVLQCVLHVLIATSRRCRWLVASIAMSTCNTHCNTLQHTATHSNTLQHTTERNWLHLRDSDDSLSSWNQQDSCSAWHLDDSFSWCYFRWGPREADWCCYEHLQQTLQHTLQYTATHCNTLHDTATHDRERLVGLSWRWKWLLMPYAWSRAASPRHGDCNALQHTAAHCNTLQHALQHAAIHCNTRQKETCRGFMEMVIVTDTYRERKRERERNICIYICIHKCIYTGSSMEMVIVMETMQHTATRTATRCWRW